MNPSGSKETPSGLTQNDHGLLKDPEFWEGISGFHRRSRLSQLRELYRDNPVALEQIQTYDPKSEVSRKLNELTNDVYATNAIKKRQLESWFAQYFPHLFEEIKGLSAEKKRS